ncbi:M14 family metallocarboxypeptidase [Pseudalkalibacillus sp. SCS-8]|uniref:M14 family metallopeptidase n=1 Tax=Pseudalkalibacillus nanhaiensis TaxID=3115291 RepID=UPI0032DAA6E7
MIFYRSILILTSMTILIVMMLLFPKTTMSAEGMPYYGKTFSQPDQVQILYSEPEMDFGTPAFQKEREAFTTQEELIRFIVRLDDSSNHLTVKTIGQSSEGRAIPALFFFKRGGDNLLKPTIWLQGQIHGNEPAGGEGVLVIAKRLTEELGEKVLDHVNIIIVPRVNPDGSYRFQRGMDNDLDGNRDYLKLDLPETKAIRTLFNKYQPEVVIDAHEYTIGEQLFSTFGEAGYLKYHDLLLLSGKNLNIPKRIRDLSDDLFIKRTHNKLTESGFSVSNYYVADVEDEKVIVKEGGTTPRIGRNALGLTPSISVLVESRGIGIGREQFKRRVTVQVEAITELIKITAGDARKIKRLVWSERAKIVNKGLHVNDEDWIVIQDERKELDGRRLEVIDVKRGEVIRIPVQYFSSTDAEPVLIRERPTAYLIDSDQIVVVEKLKQNGVKVYQHPYDVRLPVESFIVTEKKDGGDYEDHRLTHVKTKVTDQNLVFKRGTYVVLTAQPASNIAAIALEPESEDSYVTFNLVPTKLHTRLPIYRFVQNLNPMKPLQSIMDYRE